ncbi:MAG: Stp1/IreP family PP2C-type Ser/Thr phosphatase [Firmicutes bacterium]|uniref:Stp1/IreP family PP2C-type Ser/Thr phosphatase n=1 Tax=Candidatus Onthovivens merdipullorum TaxID=2840889 RepID=A0A9D9GV37_9BACL|nr:Stp1/IreP family PP2C-type Ser/Thr phosphatase [Candidatus Onthovivens merdipullorum]
MKSKVTNGTFSYKKDIGKVRLTNEDEAKILVNSKSNVLMMVADGMGGENKGDYASIKVINTLANAFKDRKNFISKIDVLCFLKKYLRIANKEIYDLSLSNPIYKGMGTTIVIAFLYKNYLIVANSGDSRCYILDNHKLKQLSEDQTYVRFLFNSGQIKEDEMRTHPDRHVLINAIGIYPSLSVDIKVYKYNKESILLCSDGLFNNVNLPDIENILNTDDDTVTKVNSLISVANYNGGSDNISIALWEPLKNDSYK